MILSMTGFGRASEVRGGREITVELRSVNARYFEYSSRIPRSCSYMDGKLKKLLNSRISRGKVELSLTIQNVDLTDTVVSVDLELARSYQQALRDMSETLGVKNDVTAGLLARFPDVLTVEKKEQNQEQVKAGLLGALDAALADFDSMRVREGQRLAEDILGRAVTIEGLVSKVEERSPQTVAEYRARLEAKMAEILQNTQIEESRILTEAAIYADKVAVDEETVRLRSHIDQLREMLSKGGATGRKLDFLIQEFNREANTIGSKCNDIDIARVVVDIKAEIEKIREQVQNLE